LEASPHCITPDFVCIAESDKVFTVCDQWFRGRKGQRMPSDESCQLWLPIKGARTETACRGWTPTRPGPTLVLPVARLSMPEEYTCYGAAFEHVARPSLPIVGTGRGSGSQRMIFRFSTQST
jgi:hypothetical protein